MICKYCEYETNSYQGLAKHLSTKHNIKSKDYYDQYMRPPNTGKCICGKDTPFLSLKKGYQKHCCAKCAQLDPNTSNNFRVSNPQKNEKIKHHTLKTCNERYDGRGYGSKYLQIKSKITRFNNKYLGGNNMPNVKQVEFSVKPLNKTDQYFGFSLEEDPMYLMPDGTVFHNSGKSVCEQSIVGHVSRYSDRFQLVGV